MYVYNWHAALDHRLAGDKLSYLILYYIFTKNEKKKQKVS